MYYGVRLEVSSWDCFAPHWFLPRPVQCRFEISLERWQEALEKTVQIDVIATTLQQGLLASLKLEAVGRS